MAIVVQNLQYIYMPGSAMAHTALSDISFTVNEGEFLGIIGHTGSGKSTLIQHLNGLVQPSAGTVTVDGLTLSDKKQRIRARSLVGMVFQYPEYQLFEETVAKDIAFGPKNMGLSDAEIQERITEAMALVGLDYAQFAEKSPFDLSGGEKRRAALAGIVAMRPKYLVLDEPMAGLDPKGRKSILDMVLTLRKTTGCAIVMVSHSMDDIAENADRVLMLNDGTIAMLDTPEAVFRDAKALEEMGLSLPKGAELRSALEARGITVPARCFTTSSIERWLVEVTAK
ncbi:MAG: energy-coupling factor transporter ATPase [Eubacteriales bacterium]|nr:energy-coupling factor transporter ATPase [Eubacteriales bacterium]